MQVMFARVSAQLQTSRRPEPRHSAVRTSKNPPMVRIATRLPLQAIGDPPYNSEQLL